MAKSKVTSGKKDREKKRLSNRKDKEQRREERKANSNKGKGFDSMIAYVDEFGRLTSTPPDPSRKIQIKAEDIEISIVKQHAANEVEVVRTGRVSFFNNEKGYGFIKDINSQESIFVHANNLSAPIKENDLVTFEVERGQKGLQAVNVKIS